MRKLFWVLPFLMLTLVNCEGPTGTEGPQGPTGPEGPVGPAGEDGSKMYAGPGQPSANTGVTGDYYLDTDTGELYGPKDSEGWGNPTIVLMGEDGIDGTKIHSGSGTPGAETGSTGDFYIDMASQDLYGPKTENGWGQPVSLNGEDGVDGQDGSQIHSGSGVPPGSLGTVGDYYLDKTNYDLYGPKTDTGWGQPINLKGTDGQDGANGQDGEDGSQIYSGIGAPDSSLGVVGDYYLDKANYDLYGPKTSSGWGIPLNLKGADGNANVTRYLFPGFSNGGTTLSIDLDDVSEMRESAWIVYLVVEDYYLTSEPETNYTYFHIPGRGRSSVIFDVSHYYSNWVTNPRLLFSIWPRGGSSQSYDGVEVVRIKANQNVNHTKQTADAPFIPDGLDLSNYEAVATYFGF